MSDKPQQLPEGALIQRAMIRTRLTARRAATKAGMSEGRWRQIVNGYQSVGRGRSIPVIGVPVTLARMALAVDLTADDMAGVGRADVADIMRDLARGTTPGGRTTAAPETRGRILYIAYGDKVKFRTWDGRPMPSFDDLGAPQRDAWIHAAGVLWQFAMTGRVEIVTDMLAP